MLIDFYRRLGRGSKAGLLAGVALIVIMTVVAGVGLLRSEYRILFSDLTPQDAAVMVSELERLKQPYRLEHEGTSILVERDAVHRTRIKLMGKELPLNGTVGFELFNNADFGMTEFAQKVNYQRALQGEIARTIMSLTEVASARVHLALPEEGIFKRPAAKPKAAVTLNMKKGHVLHPQQVAGIQRLVSASVPGILATDVTIVDQQGIALTRHPHPESGEGMASLAVDLKKEVESHMARKVAAMLEQLFGPGGAIVSVDATLNMDQVRITNEDVASSGGKGQRPGTGVIVREREFLRDSSPFDARTGDGTSRGMSSSQREVEYQVGRRVEQVVSQPGTVRRIQMAIIVRGMADRQRLDQVRELAGAAVGASAERGDVVVVHGVNLATAREAAAGDDIATDPHPGTVRHEAFGTETAGNRAGLAFRAILALFLAATVAGVCLFAVRRRESRRAAIRASARQAALIRIRQWLGPDAPPATAAKGGME